MTKVLRPSPQTTLVVLLGASVFPRAPRFESSEAFANSARDLEAYFLQSFQMPQKNLLNLFDAEESPPDLEGKIGDFLKKRIVELRGEGFAARDAIFYYVGHGGFTRSNRYHLPVRYTQEPGPESSNLGMESLAHTLKENTRSLRRILILDCCFAATAVQYQAAASEAALRQTIQIFEERDEGRGFPSQGTSLLCSSDRNSPSITFPFAKYTTFSEALLFTLNNGSAYLNEDHFSLGTLSRLMSEYLFKCYQDQVPRPEVHSPDQSEGDVASVPFFPNPKPSIMGAERVCKEGRTVLRNHSDEVKGPTNTIQSINIARIPVEWVFIPEGSTMMEKVEAFFISKYPVTYKQFQAFIDDENGYSNEHWWKELAIRFDQPAKARWAIPNHPRETVSWYEAIAFCQWLSNKIGRKVTLPTEVQWQRAAQGDDDRDYSWGKVFSKTRCNTSESGNRRTTPVNRYSSDASPYGAVDMCGNVKEWCLNEHTSLTKIDLGGDAPRALRGGSWKNDHLSARVGYHDFSFPNYRLDSIGFRIVAGVRSGEALSPSSSPSLPLTL